MTYWERRLGSEKLASPPKKPTAPESAFAKVVVEERIVPGSLSTVVVKAKAFTIRLSCGLGLEFNTDINPAWVASFIMAIREIFARFHLETQHVSVIWK